MRVAVQRGAVVAPSSREKRQMVRVCVCVCVNVLCGIVRIRCGKNPLFFPLKEKDIFIKKKSRGREEEI